MLRSIVYKAKDECCSCVACANICPGKQFSMRTDILGFPYSVVNDESVCVVDCVKEGGILLRYE